MSEQLQQCDNCLKMLPQSKIATHLGYCRRNIKKCQECGNMYDINLVEDHQEEFHKKEKCGYCNNEFSLAQAKNHKEKCAKKPKYCDYCQQNIPIAQYELHLRQCQSRTKICQKCGKDVINKQYFTHIVSCEGPSDDVFEIPNPNNYRQHIQQQRNKINKNEVPKAQNKIRKQQTKKQVKPMDSYLHKIEKGKKPIYSKPVVKKQQPKSNGRIPQPAIKKLGTKSKPEVNNHKQESAYPRKKNDVPVIDISQQQNSMDFQQPNYQDNFQELNYHDNLQEPNYHNNYQEHYQSPYANFNSGYDEGQDAQLQRALLMSMGVPDKQSLPADFKGLEMNASFYRDLQLQDAAEEQIRKRSKK